MKEINREKKKTNGKYYMVRSVLWEAKTDRFTYLVFKNGIIIPAAVATNNSTTCNTVKTTFINLTTSARALELSMPSTVTYCCWDRCSILVICWKNRKQNIRINESRLMNESRLKSLPLFDNFPELRVHHAAVHRSGIGLFLLCRPAPASDSLFHSRIEKIYS